MRVNFRTLAALVSPLVTVASVLSPSVTALAAPSPTRSRTAHSSDSLDEIIVTAQRRRQSEFDVPLSVTAISGQTLNAGAFTSINGIVGMVPNANVTANPQSTSTYVSIRGITQGDVNAEANFGAYRNGVFTGGHLVNLGPQIDVSRVEVLRGPQGGLYGRDAVGGAINVIYRMPKPGDRLHGYLNASYGNKQRTQIDGAITVPINDKISTRTTAWYIDQGQGDFYNITLHNYVDKSKDEGLRFSTAAQITDPLSFLGTVEYQKNNDPGLRTYAPNGVKNGPYVTSPAETPTTIQRDTNSRLASTQLFASARLRYALSAGSVTLQSAYRDYRINLLLDQDHTALAPTAGPLVLQQVGAWADSIKQTLVDAYWQSNSTGPISTQAGISYFNERYSVGQDYTTSLDTAFLGSLGVPNIGVISGTAGIPNTGSAMSTHSFAGFADVRYSLTPSLSITGILRYTRDSESLGWSQGIIPGDTSPSYALPIVLALFNSQVPTFSLASHNTFSYTSPSLDLQYKYNRHLNLYALYSTGFRPGGYNTTVTTPADIPYGQETAKNYEAGFKSRWLQGKAALNFSIFRMDQYNLAIQQTDLSSTLNFTYLANVGSARTDGYELEAMIRPIRPLTASLSVGHLNSTYTRGTVNAGTPQQIDLTGRVLSGVRPWTINAQLHYDTALSNSIRFSGLVDARRETGGAIGNNSDYPLQSLTLLNLAASLTLHKNTQVTLYDHNATNKMIPLFVYATGDVGTNIGRRFGLQVTQKF